MVSKDGVIDEEHVLFGTYQRMLISNKVVLCFNVLKIAGGRFRSLVHHSPAFRAEELL